MSSIPSSGVSNDQTLNQVNLHLSAIDNHGDALFCLRAMKGHSIKLFSTIDADWQQQIITLINEGFDIFVTINQTDGKGVKTENITRVRSLFLDLDNTDKDNLAIIDSLPLPPNLVVNTSKGKFHCYLAVEDCSLEQFSQLQKQLASRFYGDPSVCDLPRIMRLAGSYHRKAEPYFVHVVRHHEEVYSLDDILTSFGFDSFVSDETSSFQKNTPLPRQDRTVRIEQLKQNIYEGYVLHNSLLSLAKMFANDGKPLEKVVVELQGLLGTSKVKKEQRYHDRFNDIPRLVEYAFSNQVERNLNSSPASNEQWPEPQPLIAELKPVLALNTNILPNVIQGVVKDTSGRMQCPPDFMAASTLVVSSAIVARRVVVQPKQKDTGWRETPNLWGVIIGKPSLMKSPTLSVAMAPIDELENRARKTHLEDMKLYQAEADITEMVGKANKKKIGKGAGSETFDRNEAVAILLADADGDDDEPEQPRFKINDGTVEKVGELLKSNPLGLLYFRDELSGWLNSLSKPDKANDRPFYLESWNGDKSYTYDRIGRGTVDIPTNRLSIQGGIQPDMFARTVADTLTGSQGGDGMLQRFQLAVYPDVLGKGTFVDREPDFVATKTYEQRLIELAEWSDAIDGDVVLKLNPGSYIMYKQWFEQNEELLHSENLLPSLESHYAKYRGLVPSLAAIFYVLDNHDFVDNPNIDEDSMSNAIEYVEYLRSHSERIYALPEQAVFKAAKSIISRFDKLSNPFTARDLKRKQWSGLTDAQLVDKGLALLEGTGHCKSFESNQGNGRPTFYFVKHPKYQLSKLTKPVSYASSAVPKNKDNTHE